MKGVAYDVDNKPIKCDKCNRLASFIACGESGMFALCSEHSPIIETNRRQVVDSSATTKEN
jgi:hypothetical protein